MNIDGLDPRPADHELVRGRRESSDRMQAIGRAGMIVLFALALGIASGTACAAQAGPFVLATPQMQQIGCEETPFGKDLPLARNIEPFYFKRGSAGQTVDEYRSPAPWEDDPIYRVYRSDLIQSGVASRSWRAATAADLNGDGRDELIAVFSDGADVRVVVYERGSGLQPAANVLDQWSYADNVVADSIQVQAGDFDGSTDGRQELALSWQTGGTTRVVFLTGANDGGIAQAANATAGTWTAPSGSDRRPRLARGDFLLDGRDQVVLVGMIDRTNLLSATVTMDLIEWGTPWPASVLPRPAGSTGNIGSLRFGNNVTGLAFETGAWGSTNVTWQLGTALDADGADLVDSTASELVVHVQFQVTDVFTKTGLALAQRLFHFDTQRDSDNAITAISLGNGGQHDASRIVGKYSPLTTTGSVRPAPAFDAVLADIDGIPPLEIVTLEAGREPGNEFLDAGALRWQASHAYVRLASGFSYENMGSAPGSGNELSVRFRSLAHGEIAAYEWNFGGGFTSPDSSPIKNFSAGDHVVRLKVTGLGGETAERSMTVHVGGANDAFRPAFVYGLDPAPIYTGRDASTSYSSASLAQVAAGDIDNDGIPEVLTVARDNGNTLHRQAWKLENSAIGTFGFRQVVESVPGLAALGLVISDFDGNSVHASLGVDCRQVTDQLTRTLTWLAPYFSALQGDVYKSAAYGMTIGGSNGYEERSGSYFSNDISGYIGISNEIAVFGLKVAEWSARVTAGHNWQTGHGRFSGTESEYSLDEGASTFAGGGLVEAETQQSKCYSYDVENSEGQIPGSALRMCEVIPGVSARRATDAVSWNTLQNEARPVIVPLHWVPMQRDWASISLFRPVTASNLVSFPSGHEADKATDGLFTTSAESSQATTRPYLDVDLGSVRDIGVIRVFPTEGRQKQFVGYRIYASESAFTGPGVPSGAGVREFRQNTGDTETTYRTWNIWTRNAMDPGTMLRARYLRLQYPGNTSVELHVAEIQVFGDTEQEPPTYPDAVCDPSLRDDYFIGKVWDPVHHLYRNIELRGALIWSGSDDNPVAPGSINLDSGVTLSGGGACYNGMNDQPTFSDPSPRKVAQYSIWKNRGIGGSGTANWNLSTAVTQSGGNYRSIDSATRIGAEFEAQAGLGTSVMIGAAYEFTFGATQDVQTSFSWSNGLAIGAEMSGFENPPPGVIDQCEYFPRPYAFNLREYSNVGFAQNLYVTDYVVKQLPRGSSTWQRNAVPATCFGGTLDDSIFANGFDG